jgi:peptidyl-prolyl cis-trans isomerase C
MVHFRTLGGCLGLLVALQAAPSVALSQPRPPGSPQLGRPLSAQPPGPQPPGPQPPGQQSPGQQSAQSSGQPSARSQSGQLVVQPPGGQPSGQPLQGAQSGSPPPEIPVGAADPVVVSVDGHQIHLSDVGRVVQSLPPTLRDQPFDKLYPDLLERLIDHQALVMMARRSGIESSPQVQQDIQTATDRILEGAYLAQNAVPKVTEEAIRARFDQLYSHRPITEEVRARHILVSTEAEARAIIEDIKKGADFVTLARGASRDPDGEKGGDLGFLRRSQLSPGFADVVFGMQPGQVAPDPIHNEFGWHVVKLEEKRQVPPPSYGAMHDQIRQDLLAEAVSQAVQQARGQVIVHRYNVDGTEISPGRQTDAAASLLPQ